MGITNSPCAYGNKGNKRLILELEALDHDLKGASIPLVGKFTVEHVEPKRNQLVGEKTAT